MESSFFVGAQRRVLLGSVTKQHSTGRIVVAMRMPLTGESLANLPDWLSSGYEAVAKNFTQVEPEIREISDLTLHFWNDAPKDELFRRPSAKLPGASIKGFLIARCGEEDNPEVEMRFKVYGPFTREFWAWIGEMSGEEVYLGLPPMATKQAVATDTTADLPLEEPTTESTAAESNIPGITPTHATKKKPAKKSGPHELAAEHERHLDRWKPDAKTAHLH